MVLITYLLPIYMICTIMLQKQIRGGAERDMAPPTGPLKISLKKDGNRRPLGSASEPIVNKASIW